MIKIEPPEGDEMRQRAPVREGQSAYFGQLNAGKKSVALDLKSPEAIKLVHHMIESTDIVVENLGPVSWNAWALAIKRFARSTLV